jgi:cytidylate kinase
MSDIFSSLSFTSASFAFSPRFDYFYSVLPFPTLSAGSYMIIAIDGPAGSGKSSTAKAVAARLGITYLDTGAMYRAITLRCLREGIGVDDAAALERIVASASIRFAGGAGAVRIFLDDEDVTEDIRSDAVTRKVSDYCAPAIVRRKLVEEQRKIAQGGSIVCEGRDIGTVVFPDADLKFFMTATPQERARRRRLDFQALGVVKSTAELIEELSERDRKDATREHSPLRKAPDAEEIDTTVMTFGEQVDYIVNKTVSFMQERNRAMPKPYTSNP